MTVAIRNVNVQTQASVDEFKGAMRALAGGVSIITAGRDHDITGMTVTSVTSLSVEPPSLIVSVNRASSTFPLLSKYGVFGVNIPTSEQREVAERFAGEGGLKGAQRFSGANWETRVTGVPLLIGALATLDCEVEELIERHSHVIVIGRVRSSQSIAHGAGLGYFQGEYADVVRGHIAPPLLTDEDSVPLDLREF